MNGDAISCVSTANGKRQTTNNMEKFNDKYRIPSARAAFWDYGWNAAYFITICTQNRECWFGNVVDGKMNLSPFGHIANSCWHEIPNHFPFVELGGHIIMPNHVHGVVIINKQGEDDANNMNNTDDNSNTHNQFAPQSRNLASIIRGFKIGVTTNVRKINSTFAWQSRFHDRIIRDEGEWQRIAQYIINNPQKWDEDEHYHP